METATMICMCVAGAMVLGGCATNDEKTIEQDEGAISRMRWLEKTEGLSSIEFNIPSSLIYRMQRAYSKARNKHFGITGDFDGEELYGLAREQVANAEAIARRPRGEMKFCYDCLTDEERAAIWPLDVEAFEAELEKKMVLDQEGFYRLKPGVTDLPVNEDGLVAVNPTMRWVSKEIEQWAVKELDARYSRMEEEEFCRIMEVGAMSEDVKAWAIGEDEIFIIEQKGGAWDVREYAYFIHVESIGWWCLATMESFPTRKEGAALRVCLYNGAAMNNVAAMEWSHRSMTTDMRTQIIEMLLGRAVESGIKVASHNLEVLFEHIPELETGEFEAGHRKLEETQEYYEQLWVKWPGVAERVSMWDMPDYAKRFFEIDAFQDWCNEDKKARYGEFEQACREAIAMKIEPPVWYYNLACTLAVQGKQEDAIEALEQAVVAGYNKAELAKSDGDFESISNDPRFVRLLQVMDLPDLTGWQWANKPAMVVDDVVELTEDNVYFGFIAHMYIGTVEEDGYGRIYYMDRDGLEGPAIKGYVTVKYDEEAKKRGRHLGLANTAINNGLTVARGKFVPEEIKTDAYDAELVANAGNVLGLYSCEDWSEKLEWCILYHGGEAEGRKLAEIVRDAIGRIPVAELDKGRFAPEMVALIHAAMKPGTDGPVINVDDLDIDKLLHGDLGSSLRD